MRRREFIAGLGATIAGSIETNAQELPSLAFVGYLDDGPAQGFIFRQVVFREGLAEVPGGTVLPGSPADFGKLLADKSEKWAKVVKFAGIKAD